MVISRLATRIIFKHEDANKCCQGLQDTDERNGLIGNGCIHLTRCRRDPEEVVVCMKDIIPPAAQASMATTRPMGDAKPRTSIRGVIIVAAVTMAMVAEPTQVRKMNPMMNGARIPMVRPEKESVKIC